MTGVAPGGSVAVEVGCGVNVGNGVKDGNAVDVADGASVAVEVGGDWVEMGVADSGDTCAFPLLADAASVIWAMNVDAAWVYRIPASVGVALAGTIELILQEIPNRATTTTPSTRRRLFRFILYSSIIRPRASPRTAQGRDRASV